MNKVILIVGAFAVLVTIGAVPISDIDGNIDESDNYFEELLKYLEIFCTDILADDSEEDEKQDNGIWNNQDKDYRKKRDFSEDGLDLEVLGSKDGPTLLGIGLSVACAALHKLESENYEDFEEKRRKRHFFKRSVSLAAAKKTNK